MMLKTIGRFRAAAARLGRGLLWVLAFAGAQIGGPLFGTTVLPPTFDGLVAGSDYVVHGVVTSLSTAKKNTARGFTIVTRVEFKVLEPVTGVPPATLVLELWGGRVGKEALVVDGVPQFQVGGEEILFVRGNGRSVCPLVGMMHGRYAVRTDAASGRRYVARDNGEPLGSVADVSRPPAERLFDEPARSRAVQSALGPAEFIQQIKTAAGRANRER